MAKSIESVLANPDNVFTKEYKNIIIPTRPAKAWSVTSSGILMLNTNLGIGGYPRGRLIEIYGLESSGKTTIALYALLEAQMENLPCAYVDMEHALDVYYAQKIGIDIEKWMFVQPDYGEQALDFVADAIKNGIKFIVVDSVASLIPKAQIERSVEDNFIGLLARNMSQAIPKLEVLAAKNNATVIFINQIREKIGVVYGNPETTPGGHALKFYSSIRLETRKGAEIKNDGIVTGQISLIRIKKNKLCAKGPETQITVIHGSGLNLLEGIVDAGTNLQIIKKSGSWYSYGDTKLGQGKDSVIELFKDNKELVTEIQNKITAKLVS